MSSQVESSFGLIPEETGLHHRASNRGAAFCTGRGPLPSIIHWSAALNEGGGATSRMKGFHAVEASFPEKGPAVRPSQPSRRGIDRVH